MTPQEFLGKWNSKRMVTLGADMAADLGSLCVYMKERGRLSVTNPEPIKYCEKKQGITITATCEGRLKHTGQCWADIGEETYYWN